MAEPNLPVIVGAGQFTNRSRDLADAVEPLDMMDAVARAAQDDAGVPGLLPRLDSLQIVNIMAWPYADAVGLLAGRLGADPKHRVYTAVGGESPQRIINETAQAIVDGDVSLAFLCGAEVLHTARRARKEGFDLPWHKRGTPVQVVGDTRTGVNDAEARHGTVRPITMYPLFENAMRAHLGLTIDEHRKRLGALCERFSAVAATNPYAWFQNAFTAGEITTVSPDNRMICFPYPKRMNAIMQVDQAAGVILTGSRTAEELGIPRDRWIYLWGCGDAIDKWFVSDRVNYFSSPAIQSATGRALSMAGLGVDDIAMFDLYSCFPIAVQLAMAELGLALDDPRPLTLTGGLPYFGGPGNNYVMHSVAAAVSRLRGDPQAKALVTGLGWFATKHSAGVYGASPPPTDRWQPGTGPSGRTDPKIDQAQLDAMDSPPTVEHAEGPASVETYTVQFDRDGNPELGIVIGRMGDGEKPGARFLANIEGDSELLWSLTREEFIGASGHVSHHEPSGRNIFRP